jgi:acyl carrier protein
MEHPSIYVPKLVATYADIPIVDCRPSTKFGGCTGLNIDSLDLLTLGMEAEEYYDIDIPEKEYDAVKTVQDFVDILCRYIPKETKYDSPVV